MSENHYDDGGSGGFVLVFGWIALLFFVSWLVKVLKLRAPYHLYIWAALHILAAIFIAIRSPSIPMFLGLLVSLAFSWAAGRAVFDGEEYERSIKDKHLTEERANAETLEGKQGESK